MRGGGGSAPNRAPVNYSSQEKVVVVMVVVAVQCGRVYKLHHCFTLHPGLVVGQVWANQIR